MILLDTVVLSETQKRKPSSKVMAWLKTLRAEDVYLSVISIGEIERGIAKARLTDEPFAVDLNADGPVDVIDNEVFAAQALARLKYKYTLKKWVEMNPYKGPSAIATLRYEGAELERLLVVSCGT